MAALLWYSSAAGQSILHLKTIVGPGQDLCLAPASPSPEVLSSPGSNTPQNRILQYRHSTVSAILPASKAGATL